MNLERIQIERDLFRRSLKSFITGGAMRGKNGLPVEAAGAVAGAWDIVDPGTPLVWNWAHDAICEFLFAATLGDIHNGLIEAPPRIAKSRIVSTFWPAWCWTLERNNKLHAPGTVPLVGPAARFIGTAYDNGLASDFAIASRAIMQHQWYLERWGDMFAFKDDKNRIQSYENDRGGERKAVGAGTGITGKGGDCIICDDPLRSQDAYNVDKHQSVSEWWTKTIPTRINNPKTGVKIVVMQRFHAKDLAGVCRELDYEVLSLPMRYDTTRPNVCPIIGFKDPRRADGELLIPERFGQKEVDALVKNLGSHAAGAQLDQKPTVDDSESRFPKSLWARWSDLPRDEQGAYRRPDEVLSSWDTTFKGKTKGQKKSSEPDYVVGTLWYRYGRTYYLIDRARGQWDFNECCKQMVAFIDRCNERWPFSVHKHLIETKANGEAIISEFKAASIEGRRALSGMIGFDPSPYGDKESRAYSLQGIIESANVVIPEQADWLTNKDGGGWLDEWQAFPDAKNDDSVDSGSQALIYFRQIKQPQIR